MKQKGNKKGFTGCAQAYIRKLRSLFDSARI